MDLLNIIAVLITLSACFNYINHQLIGLSATIGDQGYRAASFPADNFSWGTRGDCSE